MTNKANGTKQVKKMNQDYIDDLMNLWNCCQDMMTHTQNELGEMYRLSRIVSLFASQKAKVDKLRDMYAQGSEKHDIFLLKRVAYFAERQQEEKAFDYVWEKVAQEYDQIVDMFCQKQSNDNICLQIMTAEEILESAKQYYDKDDKNKYELAEQTAKAMIDL